MLGIFVENEVFEYDFDAEIVVRYNKSGIALEAKLTWKLPKHDPPGSVT